MNRTFYALLGRHAHLISVAAGLAVFVLAVALSLQVLKNLTVETTLAQHRLAAEQGRSASASAVALLKRLNAEPPGQCTPERLRRLRALMLEYRFIRDIGLYNAEDKLYCWAGLGPLAEPVADAPTPFMTPEGGKIWFDAPLALADGKVTSAVGRLGRYSVAIDPFAIADVLKSSIDVIWFTTPALIPVRSSARTGKPLLAVLQARVAAVQEGTGIALRHGFVDIITPVPDTWFVLQSYRSVADIIYQNPRTAGALFLLAGLFSALVLSVLMPRLQSYATLAHRIRYLCDEAHVRCLYQPIVDLRNGHIVGCEVLMRLHDRGVSHSPEQTLPLLARAGLGWELDRLVTARALRELAEHLPGVEGFMVAFNLLPENIVFAEVDAHLHALVEHGGQSNLQLVIEVAEAPFDAATVSELHRFEQAGYRLAVDDFGTGHSNLASVRRIRPDFLKIDNSFVFEMEDSSVRSSLIPEIVGIARAVDAEVIAEGIENERQVDKLLKKGVRYGQGDYFAAPQAIGDFARLCAQGLPTMPSAPWLHVRG